MIADRDHRFLLRIRRSGYAGGALSSSSRWAGILCRQSPGRFREDCLRHLTESAHAFEGDPLEAYSRIEGIAIDYGLVEKTAQAVVVLLHAEWDDLGSIDSLYRILTKDESGNAVKEEYIPSHQGILSSARGMW